MDRVRVNGTYRYVGGFVDSLNNSGIVEGDRVTVVNLHGCPPANTMGFCYVVPTGRVVANKHGEPQNFAMVRVSSLEKVSQYA